MSAIKPKNLDATGEALRASELRYRRLFESAKDGILILDAETGMIVDVNPFLVELLGVSRETFLRKKVWELGFFKDILANEDKFYELRTQKYIRYENLPLKSFDGRPIAVEFVSNVYLVNHQRVIQCNIRDITRHKRAEEALRQSEERFRIALDATKDGVWEWDIQANQSFHSPRWFEILGYSSDDPELPSVFKSWESRIHPDDYDRVMRSVNSCIEKNSAFDTEYRHRHKSGEYRWQSSRGKAVCDESGKTVKIIGCISDITERKRIETDLRNKELLLSESQRLGHIGSWLMNMTGPSAWSDEFYRLLGLSPNEFPPTFEVLFSVIHPDDRHLMQSWVDASAAGEKPEEFDFRINLPDGTIRFIRGQGESVFDVNNKLVHMAGTAHDITHYKIAEEEKAKLESQLQQAQKMESVGRLAGGVAHDFNNMLGVILGHAELALQGVDSEQPLHDNLMEIHKAAMRSADLTRQLLAFARKQTVAPRILDLNQTVANMLKMLQRLIGEDINLKWHPLESLWQVKIDPNQIDQILANLCVNARDAIKDGGNITIETGNGTLGEDYCAAHIGSAPGEYVTLTVSDDGSGMDKKTLAQIFEPFFTTKGIGEGTGLGLSMVYGIVKQNNGYINVYSEMGHGTMFTIYLPRHEGNAGQAARTVVSGEPRMHGHETVLLVEDDPSLLKLTARMIEKHGYTVLVASTPGEALHLTDEYGDKIRLLMTDVVMPGMNGRDLAKNLLDLIPNLKLLFMSGYTADVIAHNGVLDEGVHFIQKPFSVQSLATKLREALDSV
jgi:two-component system cell cycle sensor histidine kinase/response regulator CckA